MMEHCTETVVPKYRWAKEVKELYDDTCVYCGMKNTGRNLHAHHVAPKAANPELENVLENGIALCYNCHRNGIHDGNGGISNSEKAQRIKAAIREQKENEILVTIPKGEREKIKTAAAAAGMSMNAFIVESIAEKIGK